MQHRDQGLEVTRVRGRQERPDDLPLTAQVGVRRRGRPCTRRRARLASCRVAVGVRPTIGAMSSKGTANMSCSTKARRSAGDSVSSTTSSASPTDSASSAACSGSPTASGGLTTGSGTRTSSSGDSPREVRERSMSRHTRPTTVVSQPPRFSIPSAPARFSRSHASCTASSASVSDPSMR